MMHRTKLRALAGLLWNTINPLGARATAEDLFITETGMLWKAKPERTEEPKWKRPCGISSFCFHFLTIYKSAGHVQPLPPQPFGADDPTHGREKMWSSERRRANVAPPALTSGLAW